MPSSPPNLCSALLCSANAKCKQDRNPLQYSLSQPYLSERLSACLHSKLPASFKGHHRKLHPWTGTPTCFWPPSFIAKSVFSQVINPFTNASTFNPLLQLLYYSSCAPLYSSQFCRAVLLNGPFPTNSWVIYYWFSHNDFARLPLRDTVQNLLTYICLLPFACFTTFTSQLELCPSTVLFRCTCASTAGTAEPLLLF